MASNKEVQSTSKVDELREALLSKAHQLEQSYADYEALIKESDSIIKDLDNRKLVQREARNIYIANSIKIQEEYAKINAQLKELESDSDEKSNKEVK